MQPNEKQKLQFKDYHSPELYTWCTGCGNYAIHTAIKHALVDLNIAPHEVVLCFDIGCNGNGSDKIRANAHHGLHGRVLPLAAGVHLANRRLKVIAFGGDGATFSEGVNHLIHSIRCDYDFTLILHDNKNYGLTTGQCSSTTPCGNAMNSSPDGQIADTVVPMNLVLALDPSFAARTFSGNVGQMREIFKKAINHRGFSYVEVLQSCPTYNKFTPHKWYMDRVYEIEDNFDLEKAKKIAPETERIATGVIYQTPSKLDFLSRLPNRSNKSTELVDEVENYEIEKFLHNFR